MRIAFLSFVFVVWLVSQTRAAERVMDFSTLPVGPLPTNYQSELTGGGMPADWRVIQVETSSAFPALPGSVQGAASETVVAQLSQDPTDERFPLLICGQEIYADFTAKLRFRTVSGRVEQMAGLAFRLQNPTNYYVVRASSLGNSFRFYKFIDGVRSQPIGPEIPIRAGTWHTLEVECRGNAIRCRLDGIDAIPPLNDTSFAKGRLALWTKSDSVSHFASLTVNFDLVMTLPERLVHDALDRYPRLLGITVYAQKDGQVVGVASSDPADLTAEPPPAAAEALVHGQLSAGTTRQHASAIFPLRDRNGDPLFAVKLKMRTFRGQTDSNVAARGKIIVDYLAGIVRSVEGGVD